MWYTKQERKKDEKMKKKEKKSSYDKGKLFARIMAGILVLLMLAGTGITLVYALIG